MSNLEALSSSVKEYLDSQELRYEYYNEKNIFTFGLLTETKMKKVDMIIKIRENSIVIYGMPRISADSETMAVVSEYITRANFGLTIGNFEMDFSDGELRFKSSIYCDDVPSLNVIERIVDLPFLMWKIYGDGLLACMFAGSSPEEEVKKSEMNNGRSSSLSLQQASPKQ